MRTPVLLHALIARSVSCPCGSSAVYPRPGTFVMLVGFLGFECRSCRRRFWLRRSVSDTKSADAGAQSPVRQTRPSALAARQPPSADMAELDRRMEEMQDASRRGDRH